MSSMFCIKNNYQKDKNGGLGLGVGGGGIGDWGLGPIPNPQSPIPNPQSPLIILSIKLRLI